MSKIEEQYYLSTSKTTQSGGSWTATCPAWVKGKYIWTRSKVTWSDGSVTYTTPVLANDLNGFGEELDGITISGRNLLKNTAFMNGTSGWAAQNVKISVDTSQTYLSQRSLKVVQETASDTTMSSIRIYQRIAKVPSVGSFSAYMKASKTVNISVRIGGSTTNMRTFSVGTSWTRVEIEAVTGIGSAALVMGSKNACTWWLAMPMYVEASKATDWTPAPEDLTPVATFNVTKASVDSMVSKLQYNASKGTTKYDTQISQKADKTTVTALQTSVSSLTGRVTTAESTIEAQATQISQKVSKTDYTGNTVVSLINQTATTVKIQAAKINLTGAVTMSMLATDTKNTINGKVTASQVTTQIDNAISALELGDLSKLDKVELSMLGSTVIVGGYLKTSLIKAEELVVTKLQSATGSFKSLQCVNAAGKVLGSISFASTGMWFNDCDLYHQGNKADEGGRSLRFYAGDMVVRGQLSYMKKFYVIVNGTSARYYYFNTNTKYLTLTKKTAPDGTAYYDIPLYSPVAGLEGISFNLVLLDAYSATDTTPYRYALTGMGPGGEVIVVNPWDTQRSSRRYVYASGYQWDIVGGGVYQFIRIPEAEWNSTGYNKDTTVGAGWLLCGSRDNGQQ